MATGRSISQNPTQWSSSSYALEGPEPTQSSSTYNSPTAPGQIISNLERVTAGDSQQAFSSLPQSTTNFQPSSVISGSIPSSTTQSTYCPPNTTGVSGFPDLTNMMFPSNDPFAYPNQPISVLENLQSSNPDQSFTSQLFADGPNTESYNNPSAPFYGPIPAYSMQGTQSTGAQADGEFRGFDGSQGWAQQPQGRFAGPPAGSGWDTIFGEDWSGGWTELGNTQ